LKNSYQTKSRINFSYLLLLLIFSASSVNIFAQKDKVYFSKSGQSSNENNYYYYRTLVDANSKLYKSYFNNGNLCFEGKISNAKNDSETENLYTDTCKWYHKNGNKKIIAVYDDFGVLNGEYLEYFENGSIYKEIVYQNGFIKNNKFKEYSENGQSASIIEENFANNFNDWDLYDSDKSFSDIANNKFILKSYSSEGSSRFVSLLDSEENYTIEMSLQKTTGKPVVKYGYIFGFKDWENFNYYFLDNNKIHIGRYFEGINSKLANGMYCQNINENEENSLKILNAGGTTYFAVNGEIQYKSNNINLYGSKLGFGVMGEGEISVSNIKIKEFNGYNDADIGSKSSKVSASGSGFIISKDGYIVTNEHVVGKSSSVIVDLNIDGKVLTYKANVIKKDETNDIAILKISDKNFDVYDDIKYSYKDGFGVDVGNSVFTIGFPLVLSGMGKEAKFSDGKISAKTGFNDALNSYQTTIPIQPGNSGGPVFNNKGELVGIINAKYKNADNVSYAIKLSYVNNLLDILPEKVELPKSNFLNDQPLEEVIKEISKYVVLIKIQ
jgi:S1-C subfamily serine protease